jgi:hypothetical protein
MIAWMLTVFGVEADTEALWTDLQPLRRPVNGTPTAQIMTKVS